MKLFCRHEYAAHSWGYVKYYFDGQYSYTGTRIGIICFKCGKIKYKKFKSELSSDAINAFVKAQKWEIL